MHMATTSSDVSYFCYVKLKFIDPMLPIRLVIPMAHNVKYFHILCMKFINGSQLLRILLMNVAIGKA